MKLRNKIFFVGLVALGAMSSCNNETRESGIVGSVINTTETEVNLYQASKNKLDVVETATIDANGNFKIKPKSGLEPDFYYIGIGDSKNNVMSFFTDSTENLTMKLDAEDMRVPLEMEGSANSAKYHAYQKKLYDHQDKMNDLNNQIKTFQGDNAAKEEMINEMIAIKDMIKEDSKSFIEDSKGSLISLAGLSSLQFGESMEIYDDVLDSTKEKFGHTKLHKAISTQISQAKKDYARAENEKKAVQASIGKEVPDIVMDDLNGKSRSLSSLKGKVVLVDFWASWCGPCRRENPNVVRAYDKYQKDGFEVFSVSLDKDHSKWLAAVEKDNLKWDNHVSDLKGWKNAAAAQYDVHSIPHTILLDREGKVAGVKLRGAELDQKLESLFGY